MQLRWGHGGVFGLSFQAKYLHVMMLRQQGVSFWTAKLKVIKSQQQRQYFFVPSTIRLFLLSDYFHCHENSSISVLPMDSIPHSAGSIMLSVYARR